MLLLRCMVIAWVAILTTRKATMTMVHNEQNEEDEGIVGMSTDTHRQDDYKASVASFLPLIVLHLFTRGTYCHLLFLISLLLVQIIMIMTIME